MKRNIQKTIFMMVVVLLAACAPTATPVQETLPPTQPPISETRVTTLPQVHPLDTPTNTAEIDVIIRAVASDDPQELRNLFEFRIEVPLVPWQDRQFIRISIQGYNSQEDVDALIQALQALLPQVAM